MGNGSAARRALIQFLIGRTGGISDEIATLLEDKVEQIRTYRIGHDWVRLSTEGHNEILNHLLAHPEDLDVTSAPVAAVSLVRQLARQGVPFYEIIRAYQLAHARWFEICANALAAFTGTPGELAAESIAVFTLSHGYLDRVCQQIAVEYEEEHQRWLRQEESIRLDRVLAILNGTLTDPDGSEQALGYRMRQEHLAVIAWVDQADSDGEALIRAQHAVTGAASLLSSHGRPLVIARDARTIWAWVPQPAASLRAADLERQVTSKEAGVRLALGGPARGFAGFGSTHRQAAAAYQVGRASSVATVFPYRDVSALAFLAAEPEQARTWVCETLGRLADNTGREEVLRETLAVYLSAHHSPIAAARELRCHKNTVLYRLRVIEEALGRPVDSDPLHIGLALRALRWLG